MTTTQNRPIARVALPVPLPQVFDYLCAEHDGEVVPGSRVEVPFGRRKMVGIVVERAPGSSLSADRLLNINRVLDQGEVLLDQSMLSLLQWCWQYYKHAPGEVLQVALPPALRKIDGRLPEPPLQVLITAAGKDRLEQPAGRAKAQYAMLQGLRDRSVEQGALSSQGPRWRQTLARLLELGWAITEPLLPGPVSFSPGPQLTAEQQQVVDDMASELDGFCCHLLDGVTGSGKTEVYLSLLEMILTRERQALVLVPEIGLTPQLLRRFTRRLGFEPAVIHSGLSAGERLAAWEAARTGRARLLIGTRSALFTPMPELGLIILDEEHDASFKQQDGFRYSARDVAVKRASDLGVPVVLGSATPSLESLNNVASGRYRHHRMLQRATQAELPNWRVLDMAQQPQSQGLAKGSLDAIAATLERGEQAMVFLNRRGYAPVLMCQQCGWHATCERCDSNFTWHRSIGQLCCHHCGSQKRVPALCPDCRADALQSIGEGTQQLEAALKSRFEPVPVMRFDRDSTRAKNSFEDQVGHVLDGEPCILVGTQMLAKGHHFPAVTLVVVVNVDQALYSADFRALERLGQTLLQVSGRAGRVQKPGTVILQTFHPENENLELLIREGYGPYAAGLLEERRQAGLPPVSFQAMLRAEAHQKPDVEKFLREAVTHFPAGDSRLFGPLPAIMERIGGRHRMILLAQSDSRPTLHRQVDLWLPKLRTIASGRKVRWSVDVDPQEM